MLTIRKLADRTGEQPDDGEPWPLAGIQIENDPGAGNLPTSFVALGRAEGWITVEGETAVHRPGGPPGDLWRVTHTFVHAETIVLHTVDGDVRYRVTHQPDKYVDGTDDEAPVTSNIYAAGETRVDWFYGVERED